MTTFLMALETAGSDPAVHLEDDIVLCDDFLATITPHLKTHPVQFFSRVKEDITLGSRWRPGRSFVNAQCFYLPPGMSFEVLKFGARWSGLDEHPTGLDLMVADFFASQDVRYWNHVPSLVDHAESVSLIDPRRSSRRQSLTFGGRS